MLELTRRLFGTLLGTAGTVAVAAPSIAATPAGMLRVSDGTTHPVSSDQARRLTAAFGRVWPVEERAIAIRDSLLRLSEKRHERGDEPLTKRERAQLAACDDVVNMNRAHRFLRGRDYREIFGAEGTVDQVHGMRHDLDCGCAVNSIFDHNARQDGDAIKHPHYLTRTCAAHASLAHDFRAHHKAVLHPAAA